MLFDAGPEVRGELKGLSLSLHYRLLDPASFGEFERAFPDTARAAPGRGRAYLSRSKMAFEIKANVAWGKGMAVLWMLERPRFSGTAPIYVGDDETDVDAYRALGKDGISVHVGREIAEARYHLIAHSEVKVFLETALSAMRGN